MNTWIVITDPGVLQPWRDAVAPTHLRSLEYDAVEDNYRVGVTYQGKRGRMYVSGTAWRDIYDRTAIGRYLLESFPPPSPDAPANAPATHE